MVRLPAEEDRLKAYTRLLRERFGEEPQEINEGLVIKIHYDACRRVSDLRDPCTC